MCGILGWLGKHNQEDVGRFSDALDLLKHRGPDDKGVYSSSDILLGHRRLSIQDLSIAGHQPMVDPVSKSILVFNGEIYNYIELRAELIAVGHQFIGGSDTEVLLHALIEWGEGALSRLNGMWAFSFWQPDNKKLILSRDRFGVKPLYYRKSSDGIAFSSEPKALLELFPELREVAEDTLLDFLGNNLLYSKNESFYKGIHVLPPAHCAIFDMGSGELKLSQYWDYPKETNLSLTIEQAVEQFDNLFSDAVRLRLRSDVPIGLTLSGGLDSTGILAATRSISDQKPVSFTSVYDKDEKGELPWAQKACDEAGTELIKVSAPQENWLDVLRKVTWHMDGPGYSPAVYPLWNLMKNAREKSIPVLLEGQGADEALAGYPQYAVLDFLDYITGKTDKRRSLLEIIKRLKFLKSTFSLRWTIAWIVRESSTTMLSLHRKRVGFQSLLRKGVKFPSVLPELNTYSGAERVRQRLLLDHKHNILPGLLHYGDAISMAHGIEARNPFLDYRLVEWMFKLPSHVRFNKFESKSVLREFLRSHNQVSIGNRPDKKGYPTPVAKWLSSEKGEDIEKLLLNSNSLLHKWCDPKKIKRLIENNKKGVFAAEHHLYKLVSVQLWLNECIEKK